MEARAASIEAALGMERRKSSFLAFEQPSSETSGRSECGRRSTNVSFFQAQPDPTPWRSSLPWEGREGGGSGPRAILQTHRHLLLRSASQGGGCKGLEACMLGRNVHVSHRKKGRCISLQWHFTTTTAPATLIKRLARNTPSQALLRGRLCPFLR